MHCYICDRTLSDTEIVYNRQIGQYEPCSTCLTAALDAAYTGGFSPEEEPLDDPYLQDKHGSGAIATLEGEAWTSEADDYKHGYWEGVD